MLSRGVCCESEKWDLHTERSLSPRRGRKKAMSEKIERMELDLNSRDKELYNSQQQLTVKLSDKLEKTERKHKETEHVLLDLEERPRQTNVTIKEKEFLISNLLKSEKALVERVHELRSELEDTASDVTNLFTKIERKDKIEEGNRVIIRFSPS
ncbi:hypothetical protein ACS0TY_034376 [Phlomoides rotata]